MKPLDWAHIRAHYAARLVAARQHGLTQQAIAKAGGLSGQNAISKLLRNHNQGPSVETFVKAVAGLGMDLAEFFAEMAHEGSPDVARRPLPAAPSVLIERFDAANVEAIIQVHVDRIGRELERLAGSLVPGLRPGRPADRAAPAHRAGAHRRSRKTA